MFRKGLFILAHQLGDTSFYPAYKKVIENQWKPYDELKRDQEKQLRHMISYCYKNVPYYRNLFKGLSLMPKDIQTVEDLEKLPILTKHIIKGNWESFKPVNLSSLKYYNNATGGSTGTPFQYRLSKQDRFLSSALLYRGWGYGGYELGDKMVFLAGSSLGVGKSSYITSRLQEILRNIKKLSSYNMGSREMRAYTDRINSIKPNFFRGYPSSISFYAKWIKENNIDIISPQIIFCTGEKIFPHMRKTIVEVFDCEVLDAYGLNDGGIGAYECIEHSGLHIDTERSIMEIVDLNNRQIEKGQGQILATSLHNFSMPFIRYETGDVGNITQETCNCGRNTHLLSEILGREYEILYTPEGRGVFGGFFTTQIFYKMASVKEFQVVQKKIDKLIINIVPEFDFKDEDLDLIKKIIRSKSELWDVEVNFVDTISRSGAGKYKFIINEMERT